jgi:hypothetical protein
VRRRRWVGRRLRRGARRLRTLARGFRLKTRRLAVYGCRIRAGSICPFDICRYLVMAFHSNCKLLLYPRRRCFRQKPSSSCSRCTMILRRPMFHLLPLPVQALTKHWLWSKVALDLSRCVRCSPTPSRRLGSSLRTWNTPAVISALAPTHPGGQSRWRAWNCQRHRPSELQDIDLAALGYRVIRRTMT